ncbi:MAG: GWxTD domain-containing protein [Candidatus Aminicenantes bacterium]|nr:GWxTD domain-containing protein [Candidatus Aminicenantes bacterium]
MNIIKLNQVTRLVVFLLVISSLFSTPKIKEKDLPEKYREWLKLTSYIILQQERDVFRQLTSDRDRDFFIQAFWKQRDPTPGTPQNEYRQEHLRRFIYANTNLKRGSPREGWMTDMGRIHILLGPPHSIERFDSQKGIHPCQVWYYYGEKEKGLPTYFAVVFFQRGGSGEYKLYNPTSDGPLSLLVEPEGIELTNYRKAYQKIRELAPTLADVSISMIPGQLPFNYIPSPRNNMILADIFEAPKKDVTPTYATHFLEYKGVVSTEYLTNYVESAADVSLIIDPILNINFLHFFVSPKTVSFDYFEPKDQYYCNYQLNVSLRKDKEIIYQYSKDYPFYVSPDDVFRIKGNGILIQDSFPVIEGDYGINVLIQNSAGKEFSVFEKDISVPRKSSQAEIIGPILGFKLQDHPSPTRIPFQVLNKKLHIDSNSTISSTEGLIIFFNLKDVSRDLWKEGKIEVFIEGLSEKSPSDKSFSLRLEDYPFHDVMSILHSVSSTELTPDYYQVKLVLKNAKQEILDEKIANFIVSPKEIVPHPVVLSKSFPISNTYLYFYSLAYQYDKVNELEKAEAVYEKAYAMKPDYKEGLIEQARFLLKTKKFSRSLQLIESFKEDERYKFDYFLIAGLAYMGMGDYSMAIENLVEGNKIYNSDIRLLNSLGFCYYRTNQKKKALDALKASLRLNPEQNSIIKLVQEIEK